jgi:hypothetical protein
LDLREIHDFKLACALEIIPMSQNASADKLMVEPLGHTGYTARWQDLFVEVPTVCQSYLD